MCGWRVQLVCPGRGEYCSVSKSNDAKLLAHEVAFSSLAQQASVMTLTDANDDLAMS